MKNLIKNIKELFQIMSPKQKKKYFLNLFFFLFAALLEFLGISLVFALLTIIVSDVSSFKIPLLDFDIHFQSKKLILFYVIFLYLLKSLFLSFYYWYQNKFVFDFEASISKKLFYGYLKGSSLFHSNFDSSDLIRNITVESGQLAGGILMTSLEIFRNVFLFLFLIFFLLFIDPYLTIATLIILFLIAFLYQFIISKKNLLWGKIRQIQTGLRLKKLQEGLLGFESIKILKKEYFFFKRFVPHQEKINEIRLKQTFFQNFPRIWLEFIAVFSMVILILFIQKNQQSFIDFIPVLGTLSIVIIRIIPSLNNLINNLQSFDYSREAIKKITADFFYFQSERIEFGNFENTEVKSIDFKKNINLQNISFKYPGSKNYIFNNLNLDIFFNKSIGIYGESGSGKSTLIEIILGLLKPLKGNIKIDNYNVTENLSDFNSIIGYVPQKVFIFDDSLKKNITFQNELDSEQEKNYNFVLEITNLQKLNTNLENSQNNNLGELGSKISGGEKQRIAIARALYRKSRILIFDEVTKSLDLDNKDNINKIIQNLLGKKTIINISHFRDELKNFDEIYQIQSGKMIKK